MVSSGLCHSVLCTNGTSSEDSPDTLNCPSLLSLHLLCQGYPLSAGSGWGRRERSHKELQSVIAWKRSGRWWSDSPGVWGNNSMPCKRKARTCNSSVTKPAAGAGGLEPVGGAGLLSQVSGCVEASSPAFTCQLIPGGR